MYEAPPPVSAPDLSSVLRAAGLAEGDVAGILAAATALVAHVAGQDLHARPSGVITALPRAIEEHSRVVEALRARSLSAVEADGTWALAAESSPRAWYAATAQLSPTQAGRHLNRARALRDHLPGFDAALAAGRVPLAAVDTLAATLKDSPARTAALTAPNLGEGFLVRCATDLPAADFRTVVAQWAVRVDPEAEERAWREAIDRQEVTLSPTLGGWHLSGWLAHETGLTLRTALDAIVGRPAAEDTRTRPQHNAAALHTLARRLLDSGEAMPGARIRPHVTVHVPLATADAVAAAIGQHDAPTGRIDPGMAAFARDFLDDKRARPKDYADPGTPVEAVIPGTIDIPSLAGVPPATFDDGRPLAPGQLAHALCDSEFTRYVFSGAGEPLNVGPARRLFSTRQVRAITARDRHCQFRGCTSPPSWCEAHHAIPWEQERRTDVPNGILLCWTHHQEVHRHHLTIARHPDRWDYHRPDGSLHSTVPRGAAHPAHPLGQGATS